VGVKVLTGSLLRWMTNASSAANANKGAAA
jgi:hypothetical protein